MYLAECLLSALLIILPYGETPTYDQPVFVGICHAMKGQSNAAVYVNDERRLVIEYAFMRYSFPLPHKEGTFEFRYVLGSDYAKYRMQYEDDPARVDGSELVDEQWG